MRITATWPDGSTLAWQDGKLDPPESGKGYMLGLHAKAGERVLRCPEGPWTPVADWPTDPYAFLGACETLIAGGTSNIVTDGVLPDLGPGDLDGEFDLAL